MKKKRASFFAHSHKKFLVPIRDRIGDHVSLLQEHVFDPVKNQVDKNIRVLHNQFIAVKKLFVTYEEPYSEISQTAKHFFIHIKLPNVKKKDIHLHIQQGKIEVSGHRHVVENDKHRMKGFYRSIIIPAHIIPERARALYVGENLKIKIPLRNL